MFKRRQAEVEGILARQNPEVIQQGVEAYKRDLPRLLAENRYLQHVAYRGNELLAFAFSERQLRKRLAKKGFTDWGKLFTSCIAPLDIDDDEDSERGEEDPSDSPLDTASVQYDPEIARLLEERRAEVERILAGPNRELIQQGVEAYKRDLPRLLAENRYLQHVAYRGNQVLAFGFSESQLRKRLAKKGFTDWGELFTTCITPLDIDEDEDPQR